VKFDLRRWSKYRKWKNVFGWL